MSLLSRTRFGLLDLHFAVRSGKTVLLRDVQKAPLMIVRPFDLPCGTLMVFIVNPTGGVLGGDHSEIRVRVDSGARVLLLTQSATRLQPSAAGERATQDIHFTVQEGARLEYYPERTIPFARSRFCQTLQAELEDGAEFGLTESLATGRVHMGERLQFEEYRSQVQVWQDGRRSYLDRQHLEPGDYTRSPGILSAADYVASGVWVASRITPEQITLERITLERITPERIEITAGRPPMAVGMSRGGAVWLRAAAPAGLELDQAVKQTTQRLRAHLFQATPLHIRR